MKYKIDIKITIKPNRNIMLCSNCGFCVYTYAKERKCAKCDKTMNLVCDESYYRTLKTRMGVPNIINGYEVW